MAALVLGAVATSGKAQSIYHGQFTLPVETRWGNATLPAGDYTFTVSSASSQYRLYIDGQKTNAIIQTLTAEKATSRRAQLNLVDIADVYTVETFDAPELGLTFTYWTPTQKHMSSKEARQKAVPQAAPATQGTENKTSIAVYAAGR
jgi:beta-galactosidase/beta-glucuronidase